MSRLTSIKTIIFYIGTVFLSSPAVYAEELVKRTQVMMGTYVSVSLPQDKIELSNQAFGRIKEVELALSSYDVNAEIYKLNHSSNTSLSLDSYESLALSQKYYKQTDGYFDITIGSISKELYHFGEEKTYSPSQKELKAAKLNIDAVHRDKENIRTEEGIVVDLGGIGKGYAVDKVANYLKEQNISRGIIALSGDIQCLHRCELYLQSPFEEATFAKVTAKIPNLSTSTSGTYRRYATKKSEHHLINPKTATQGKDFVSVSLFTQADNSKIDAYATAVSVMPKEEAMKFLENHKKIGYVLVEEDGNIIFGNLKALVNIEWQKNP